MTGQPTDTETLRADLISEIAAALKNMQAAEYIKASEPMQYAASLRDLAAAFAYATGATGLAVEVPVPGDAPVNLNKDGAR